MRFSTCSKVSTVVLFDLFWGFASHPKLGIGGGRDQQGIYRVVCGVIPLESSVFTTT